MSSSQSVYIEDLVERVLFTMEFVIPHLEDWLSSDQPFMDIFWIQILCNYHRIYRRPHTFACRAFCLLLKIVSLFEKLDVQNLFFENNHSFQQKEKIRREAPWKNSVLGSVKNRFFRKIWLIFEEKSGFFCVDKFLGVDKFCDSATRFRAKLGCRTSFLIVDPSVQKWQ